MNDPIATAARAAAQQLEAGPGLVAEVEAVERAAQDDSSEPRHSACPTRA